MQVEFDFRGILNLSPNCKGAGGGGIEPCDAKISKKKCLCSHHNNTALINNVLVWYCLIKISKVKKNRKVEQNIDKIERAKKQLMS